MWAVLILLLSSFTLSFSEILASGTASLTYYTSYPACCPDNPNYDPNADTTECDDYSGCSYSGDFAAIGHKSYAYVQANDLIAFYDNTDPNGNNFLSKYGGKTITLTKGSVSFSAIIADTCGNQDCNGCCAANSAPSGYLVDIEYWTVLRRFGNTNNIGGTINWVIGTAPPPPTPTPTPTPTIVWSTVGNYKVASNCDFYNTGDFASISASSASQCPTICTANSPCSFYAYAGGVCYLKSGTRPAATYSSTAACGYKTTSTPTPTPTPTPPACSWSGHCLGDPCTTYNDCDGDLICTNNKCSLSSASAGDVATEGAPSYSEGVPAWAIALLALGSVMVLLLLSVIVVVTRRQNNPERV